MSKKLLAMVGLLERPKKETAPAAAAGSGATARLSHIQQNSASKLLLPATNCTVCPFPRHQLQDCTRESLAE